MGDGYDRVFARVEDGHRVVAHIPCRIVRELGKDRFGNARLLVDCEGWQKPRMVSAAHVHARGEEPPVNEVRYPARGPRVAPFSRRKNDYASGGSDR